MAPPPDFRQLQAGLGHALGQFSVSARTAEGSVRRLRDIGTIFFETAWDGMLGTCESDKIEGKDA